MQQLVLGALLDDGGRGLVRGLGVAAVLVVLALLLALAAPLSLLGRPGGPIGPTSATITNGLAQPAATTLVQPPAIRADARTQPAPASAAVEVARRYLGVSYVFGGTNPAIGLDCSGLVQLVFRQLGISLPRTAQQQFQATTRLQPGELQPGDLVFFARTYADPGAWITHVGIYVGNGQQINAPTTGQVVSIQPVFSGFWGAHYAGAGRIART